MKYKAVICDLDGTLLNTLEDLMNSVNYGLHLHGKPEISLEQTRRFVGNGVAKLIERAVPQGTKKRQKYWQNLKATMISILRIKPDLMREY